MDEENKKYLQSDSEIKIMYVKEIPTVCEDRLLEKSHVVDFFGYFLPDLEFNNIGRDIQVSDLEKSLTDCFDAFQDVNSRRCYGLEEFNDSQGTQDYLMIKKLGDTEEKKVWKELAEKDPKMKANMPSIFRDNVFMYLRHDIGQSRMAIGFFGYDAKAKEQKISKKRDYAVVGFIQNFKY